MTNNNKKTIVDERILKYITITEKMLQGLYTLDIPVAPTDDEINRLGWALQNLARTLETRYREMQKLNELTSNINAGLLLDDILQIVYQDFNDVIPYNRIGFSLLEANGQILRAYWAKSNQPQIRLTKGYTARMEGSSLQTIIATGQPRILNNLPDYLAHKPTSESTQLVVEEGMKSSLTCPLIANGVPVGFIFFSSIHLNTYADVHIDTFQRVAGQLSIILEKGRLVSELAAQKSEIERQNQELVHLNELKNTFLGIAAHDLRGPIGNIQMITNLLLDPNFSLSAAEGSSLLEDIKNQTSHMLILLNELLDVTQIETGKLSMALKQIDLFHFLTDVVARQSMMAAAKNTTIRLIPFTGIVSADPTRLRQIVDNLVSNAVKYSPPGSKVTISVAHQNSYWKITVQDQGPGITPQDRERLFQHFAKLSARPTAGESSVGLGLAITRRMVEAHGGEIGVDSTPGQGANFWFTLPDQSAA